MKRVLKDYKFKQLLKAYTPKKLIYKYINNEICFSSKQIDELIRRKNEK